MNERDAVNEVRRLRPRGGDVVVIDLSAEAEAEDLASLSEQLGAIARKTGATVLLLPSDVRLDLIDEREMLVRGWIRVGPLAHTTAQLTEPSPQNCADDPTIVTDRR